VSSEPSAGPICALPIPPINLRHGPVADEGHQSPRIACRRNCHGLQTYRRFSCPLAGCQPQLVPLVRAGGVFHKGKLLERRPDERQLERDRTGSLRWRDQRSMAGMTPSDVAQRMSKATAPWYIAAGWALELFTNASGRTHRTTSRSSYQQYDSAKLWPHSPVSSGTSWDTVKSGHTLTN
jgi:hypothetical protein